jgi:hypothetical protein
MFYRELEKVAEDIELNKRMKPEYHHAHGKFKVEKRDKFELTPDGRMFSSYERATVVQHMIVEEAKIDIMKELQAGHILKCFPLHEKVKNCASCS